MRGSLSTEHREAILQNLRAADGNLSANYLAAARKVLTDLVGMGEQILRLPLERKPGAYTRNLLASDDLVSVWAIVWGEGSATPIHDHHCSCCFGVVSGTVTETWYRAIDEARAIPAEDQQRMAGYVACMLPSGPNIHRMGNSESGEAITIHIYGYDADMHPSSIHREYVAVNG